jgi:hypothetical protein
MNVIPGGYQGDELPAAFRILIHFHRGSGGVFVIGRNFAAKSVLAHYHVEADHFEALPSSTIQVDLDGDGRTFGSAELSADDLVFKLWHRGCSLFSRTISE